jgi:hypothetical protein
MFDHLLQILVCRGHQAKVHGYGSRAAQPLQFLFLKNAHQFRLQLLWDVANLVKEKRSFICEFKAGKVPRDCAGERTRLVAEKFAFEQAPRNGCAVGSHQGMVPPGAEVMNGPGR